MKDSINKKFNHLKIHTQYSICEGTIKIDQLKDFCKKNKIQSLGISDSNILSGALEFSETLSSIGTQPIIGTQILFKYKNFTGFIPLIAKNNIGYKNIIELSSKSYLDNSVNTDPHCSFEDLINKSSGIIVLSGSIRSLLGDLFNRAFSNYTHNERDKGLLKTLRDVMWEYCGVVKNKKLLNAGLKKIREIKNKLNNIGVRIYDHNCQDLITVMDLESSIITAEATILSALKREESRGAHQRNDYPEINSEKCFNISIKLDKNNNLKVFKIPKAELRRELKEMLSNSKIEDLNSEKLLE